MIKDLMDKIKEPSVESKYLSIDDVIRIVNDTGLKNASDFIDYDLGYLESLHFNTNVGSLNDRVFYGGGEAINNSKSLAQNIALKNYAELELKKKEESLQARIDKITPPEIVIDDNIRESVRKLADSLIIDSSKFEPFARAFENISTLYISNKDYYEEYLEILRQYQDVKKIAKFVRSISKQIKFKLNLTKKRLRNLREIFTKQHSFHFKNLDDYHDASFNYVTVS